MVLIRKNGLWRVYATRWVGLGLWGRCVSYVRENCISCVRQQISYHMHAKTAYYMHAKHIRIICMSKSIFADQYHKFSFLFGVLFIRIFMRPGCNFITRTKMFYFLPCNFDKLCPVLSKTCLDEHWAAHEWEDFWYLLLLHLLLLHLQKHLFKADCAVFVIILC